MKNDGVPLPAALSGNTVERLIRLDEALLYLVNGSLSYLIDREQFEETGTLTVDQAKTALSDMFWIYLTETPMTTPIGAIAMFSDVTAPSKWLLCEGAAVSRATYADLFAVIGGNYGTGDGTTTFNLPDFRNRSPYGVGTSISIGGQTGAATVTLNQNQIPAHTHDQNVLNAPGYVYTGGTGRNAFAAVATNSLDRQKTDATGGGLSHNNLHPILGVPFIIYAGV